MGCSAQKIKKNDQPVTSQLSGSCQLKQEKEMKYSTHQVNTLLTKIQDMRRNSNISIRDSPAKPQKLKRDSKFQDKENLNGSSIIQNEDENNNSCAESNKSQKQNRRSPYKFQTQDTNSKLMKSGSLRKSLFQSINIKENQTNLKDNILVQN
ncbi:hypothetical protein pb186bvf_002766 [Paramecium bursaria]